MNSNSEITISVIIPTFNRRELLEKCLLALERQSIEKNWEVIVVDDGGQMKLDSLINKFDSKLKIKILSQRNKGPATARNHGVRHASGEYIAFLDDDCEPDKYCIKNLLITAMKGVMIGGKTINKLSSNIFSETSQLLVSFLYEQFKNTPWYFFTSNNFLVDKYSFEQIGGFDEEFPTSAGEDRAFCAKWIQYGFVMNHNPMAIIYHAHGLNLSSFWRMHVKYGKAAVIYQKRLHELKLPLPKFQLKFYLYLIKYPWIQNHLNFLQKMAITGTLGITQFATFIGFILKLKSSN